MSIALEVSKGQQTRIRSVMATLYHLLVEADAVCREYCYKQAEAGVTFDRRAMFLAYFPVQLWESEVPLL